MSQRFNPRYIFSGKGHDYECIAMTGVREDDFQRILSLCEQSHDEPLNPRATGEAAHRRDQAQTIASLRNGGYTVKNGCITVVYEPYNPRVHSQPLSIQRVESIMTSAFLQWSHKLDPDYAILSRLNALKSPRRYAYLLEGENYAPLSKDDQRFHYLFTTLKERLDAPRMALYRHWQGPKKGYFGRVVDMTGADKAERIKQLKDRQGFRVMMDKIFADRHAAKETEAA